MDAGKNSAICEAIEKYKIIAIVRKIYGDELIKLALALGNARIRMLEVTFDQSDPEATEKTTAAIRRLKAEFEGDIYIGAGTVLSTQQVDEAAEAGAKYIISPNADEAVIKHSKKLGLVSIPGAMTPGEILNAHIWGADFVKLFPASDLGASYVKNIRSPINHIKLCATGGINLNNLKEFLDAGCCCAGIGGSLTDRKKVESGAFGELCENAKKFVEIVM
jgi:2-dehydro-3-deoxyphosphogluconate aldolase / (4S)-4-hydroxy-2-oxoglutarate aldolase